MPNVSKVLLRLGRKDLSIMGQAITGHNRLNKHESKVNSEIDPTCRFCMEDEETAWHVVGQCPAFWKERRDIFKTHILQEPEGSVGQVLKMLKLEEIVNLFE